MPMPSLIRASFVFVLASTSLLASPPAITDLVCSEVPGGVLLTWTTNALPDSATLDIVRNGDVIASLPFDATSYIDDSVPAGLVVHEVVANDGSDAFASGCIADGSLALHSPDVTAGSGGVVEIPVFLSSPVETIGFGLGYKHDPEAVAFLDVTPGAALQALNEGEGPEYFFTGDLPSGFLALCSYGTGPLGESLLPAGDDQELLVARYAVVATGPATTELSFIPGDIATPVHVLGWIDPETAQPTVLFPAMDGSTLTIEPWELPPGIGDLVCSIVAEGVLLSWTNHDDGSSASIDVIRDGEVIVQLSPDATSYLDLGANGTGAYIVAAQDGVSALGASCHPAGEPSKLRSPDVTAGSGHIVDVPIFFDSPFASFGLSFGYRHDPAKLSLLQVNLGATADALNYGEGPELLFLEEVSGVESGFIVRCIYDVDFENLLPPSNGFEMFVVTYDVDAAEPDVTDLVFTDTLGDPAMPVTASLAPGLHVVPDTDGATIFIGESSGEFIRGDADGNGTVGIIDAITTLQALFEEGTLSCAAAADVDGNHQLTLLDPVSTLTYLYQSGEPPVAPFPGCGTASTSLSCDHYVGCP